MGEPKGVESAASQDSCSFRSTTDRQFLADLFVKYQASLHRYLSCLVRPEDAAELVQETYFRLLRHGSTNRWEAFARAFLFQTATNLARDFRRRRRFRREEENVEIGLANLSSQLGPELRASDMQMLERLEIAISALPEETRTVFLLYRYRDLSVAQIASNLNVSERTVARRISEALKKLAIVAGTTSP